MTKKHDIQESVRFKWVDLGCPLFYWIKLFVVSHQ